MTDTILTDEQLRAIEAEQQRLAEIGDYPYGDGIHALVASHRALHARVERLEAALRLIADAEYGYDEMPTVAARAIATSQSDDDEPPIMTLDETRLG